MRFLFQLFLLVLTGLFLEGLRLAALNDYIGDSWGRYSLRRVDIGTARVVDFQ